MLFPTTSVNFEGARGILYNGDNRKIVEMFDDNSLDGVITDPPYENQAFNRVFGVKWDTKSGAHDADIWREVHRVLKPGAWCAVFSGSRTSWRMAKAMDEGGLEICETVAWIYASGQGKGTRLPNGKRLFLRPAHEIIWLARKPLKDTYRNIHFEWGTGGYNIEEARFNTSEQVYGEPTDMDDCGYGRYPMNAVFSHAPTCDFKGIQRVSGVRVPSKESGNPGIFRQGSKPGKLILEKTGDQFIPVWECDEENCPVYQLGPMFARKFAQFGFSPADEALWGFRSQAKPDWYERLAGLGGIVHEPPHITLKPVELGRWLVRLLMPPGGKVWDPYAGGGSFLISALLEGRNAIGSELLSHSNTSGEHPYWDYASNRMHLLTQYGEAWKSSKRAMLPGFFDEEEEDEELADK